MIFYFSGTGNTKWAAARLAAATHEDLIPIAPYMRADDSSHNIAEPFILKENERLGFVFPVHGWRVPRLVREFIRKMKILREAPDATTEGNKEMSKKHPFAYCVCTAGDSIGLTIETSTIRLCRMHRFRPWASRRFHLPTHSSCRNLT